ncbi:hypothetical protein EG359_17265 [Chryseobacterium joostei]|uniref:Rad52/22 family double-strand break repair protein n=1 Tax=Chryseobacterium joostei TaxID=112234 RepID=A0A1N7IB14_9FLAO|nr:Rad52/Rad22 family DNA repair protein [Chryseobacterium joostei]AZB01254.1 hypothetical protein EG359_17265 [Chryseobacterium joostei]SIS34220.1 Rad52/22 family double-strand break repair protein [Chryseobacterium joostei]
MGVSKEQLQKLKEPFPLKWRVKGLLPDNQMILIGYIDARQVQDRLDAVLGAENWQDDYFEIKNKQFCRIGIKIEDEWVWKADSGSESYLDASKGETSDSLKRAAVHWGINRDSYELGEIIIKCKIENGIPAPCDQAGNILKGKDLLEACKIISKEKESELIFDKTVLPTNQDPIKRGRTSKKPKIILP